MRSANEVKVVFMKELCHDFSPKSEGDPTVILAPTHGVLWEAGISAGLVLQVSMT